MKTFLYLIGMLIGTGVASAIIFVIVSRFTKTAVIPSIITGAYAIIADISVAVKNEGAYRTAAIISTVIVVIILILAFVSFRITSKKEAEKKEKIITEDDLKKCK